MGDSNKVEVKFNWRIVDDVQKRRDSKAFSPPPDLIFTLNVNIHPKTKQPPDSNVESDLLREIAS